MFQLRSEWGSDQRDRERDPVRQTDRPKCCENEHGREREWEPGRETARERTGAEWGIVGCQWAHWAVTQGTLTH